MYLEEECIFLHEDSAECKFGNDCERNNCMFKHTVPKTTKKNDGSKCEDENVEWKIEDIDSNSDDDISENETNKTFLNPSQSDDSDAKQELENMTEKIDKDATATAIEEVKNYKSELCIFQTADSKRLQRHTFEKHSVPGKKECENQKLFNNHHFFGCGS